MIKSALMNSSWELISTIVSFALATVAIVQAGSDQTSHEAEDEGVNLSSPDIAALRVLRACLRKEKRTNPLI
jgi:hypothetical protein